MTTKELLISGAGELGIPLSGEQADCLLRYADELRKWNRRINLTSITHEKDVVIKHLLDSLSFLKGFPQGTALRLLDMGSGAGFPAIPIRIARPEISITMVESVKKKCSFLRHVLRTLHLDRAEVLDMRTGEVPPDYENTYEVVTARAFAGMADALAAGARFLKPGGATVLSRGPEETVSEGEIAGAGMVLESRTGFSLPCSDYSRAIWVFRKK